MNKIAHRVTLPIGDDMPVPPKPSKPERDLGLKIGAWVVGVGLGGFVLWGTFVPLSEGVVATGSVVVANRNKQVQHLEGGIVGALHVKEDDLVEAGDVLIELDTTRNQAEQDRLEAREWSILAEVARLTAEQGVREEVTFSPTLLAEAEAGNVRVREIIEIQQGLFVEKRKRLLGQVEILRRRVEQHGKRITGLEAQREALGEESTLVDGEIETLTVLVADRVEDESALMIHRRERARMHGEMGVIVADIAGAGLQILEAQQQILQLENDYRTQSSEELTDANDLLYEVGEKLNQIRDVVERSRILAPASGKVVGLSVSTVGGVAPPGQPLMTIVPQDDLLVIDAQVRITDIDSIRLDQDARLRFTALKARDTPELTGQVVRISADAFTNQETGEAFYTVRTEVPEEEMALLVDKIVLPGMPVELFFAGRRRTAIGYLSEPITDIVRRAIVEG